jgi:hypothetical protein
MLSMDDDRLTNACREAVADWVRRLFDREPSLADAFAKLPPFGDRFDGEEDCISLRQKVTAACCARAWFYQQKPAWAPALPLDPAEIEAMVDSPDPRIRLVGFFASSIRQADWRYWAHHPSFRPYCRGLMATNYGWQADPGLLREFPPKVLKKPKGFVVLFAGRPCILGE